MKRKVLVGLNIQRAKGLRVSEDLTSRQRKLRNFKLMVKLGIITEVNYVSETQIRTV